MHKSRFSHDAAHIKSGAMTTSGSGSPAFIRASILSHPNRLLRMGGQCLKMTTVMNYDPRFLDR